MTKTITGSIGIFGRRKLRKFINQQKETMFMLDISIKEQRGLFSSLFVIEATGDESSVQYWCNVVNVYLNNL